MWRENRLCGFVLPRFQSTLYIALEIFYCLIRGWTCLELWWRVICFQFFFVNKVIWFFCSDEQIKSSISTCFVSLFIMCLKKAIFLALILYSLIKMNMNNKWYFSWEYCFICILVTWPDIRGFRLTSEINFFIFMQHIR